MWHGDMRHCVPAGRDRPMTSGRMRPGGLVDVADPRVDIGLSTDCRCIAAGDDLRGPIVVQVQTMQLDRAVIGVVIHD